MRSLKANLDQSEQRKRFHFLAPLFTKANFAKSEIKTYIFNGLFIGLALGGGGEE